MPERGQGDGAEIVHAHVVAALGQRANLGPEHEGLGAARAGAVAHEPPRRLRAPDPTAGWLASTM